MGNVHMEATQINYRGGSKKMSVEEAIKAAGTEITPEEKTWIDSIPALTTSNAGKTDQDVIAPEFDAESGIYAIGDLVMHEGKLYEFTSAHETARDWNSEEVSEKTVADEIGDVKSGLTNLISHGFVTNWEGFYCENAGKAKYTIIGDGTHGIVQVNGTMKNMAQVTADTEYTICTVPTASLRSADGIVHGSEGSLYVAAGSADIKLKPSKNYEAYHSFYFTITFMF